MDYTCSAVHIWQSSKSIVDSSLLLRSNTAIFLEWVVEKWNSPWWLVNQTPSHREILCSSDSAIMFWINSPLSNKKYKIRQKLNWTIPCFVGFSLSYSPLLDSSHSILYHKADRSCTHKSSQKESFSEQATINLWNGRRISFARIPAMTFVKLDVGIEIEIETESEISWW